MKRSRLEQTIALLYSIKKHSKEATYWKILGARINFGLAYRMITKLNDNGFLTYQKSGRRLKNLHLTEKGNQWLKAITELIDEISDTRSCVHG